MQSNLIYKKYNLKPNIQYTILIKILSKLLDNNNSLPGSGAKNLMRVRAVWWIYIRCSICSIAHYRWF